MINLNLQAFYKPYKFFIYRYMTNSFNVLQDGDQVQTSTWYISSSDQW